MPPKTKFSKEVIINTAFEIAKQEGLSGITARSVAKKLQCSVAPIYVNFSNIENLVIAVVQRVFAMTEELLDKQVGNSMFEKIGKASLVFARENPVLFRELTLHPNPYMASYETMESSLLEAMSDDKDAKLWSLEERKRLLLKLRIFQLGMSVMVANNHKPNWINDSEFDELLMEVGNDLLQAQQSKRKENI